MVRLGQTIGGTLTLTLLLLLRAAAQAPAPPGWTLTRQAANTYYYAPANLPPGKALRLIMMAPLPLGGQALPAWLQEQARQTGPRLGQVVGTGAPTTAANGLLTLVQTVHPAQGGTFAVTYLAAPAAAGQARLSLLVATADPAFLKPYVPTAVRLVLAEAGLKGGAPAAGSGSAPGAATSRPGRAAPGPRPPFSARYTRPKAGVGPGPVAGIYPMGAMQMGVGGGMYFNYQPIVAFKNGTYYEDFDVPLEDFDLAAARAARPTAFGKWRRQGSVIETYNEKKGTWSKAGWLAPCPPAAAGARLSGKFSNLSGGGNTAFGGGTLVAVSSDLALFADGTFQDKTTVGASSHEPLAEGSVVANSNRQGAGTYQLSGYLLTLRYPDGRTRRRAFAFMDRDRDAFYLDGSSYIQRGKKK